MAISPTLESSQRLMPYNADLDVILRIFYWPELDWYANVKQEFVKWIMGTPNEFSICNFSFLFDASAKTSMLQADQVVQMHSAMANAANNGIFNLFDYGVPISQYIVLNVTWKNLVQDSLRELQHYSRSDLKKLLKIKFQDEEAEDAGGVHKEFFMLLLDPKYSMFKEFEESRELWFADITYETENMCYLIGVLCGLAIYNFTIINLPFPLALYKKLLNKPVDLSDLQQLSPAEVNSLQALLDYDGENFSETFDLNFEISRQVFGVTQTLSLMPNGEDIGFTLENRQQFVELSNYSLVYPLDYAWDHTPS
ncbi:probable E3 ubiquitin-protein ligase HERC3 [Drosophila pseudoobscura]|uniref:HECT-type E3 ubiquitin transferase n=1 Tax=Drosophila pseudoobscura pseudoobscura TaxID=46245 RepID=A0A6I8WAD3_DROPS|nr:probable E3 ubiquitin-protein ligase HERC3 [Drosophila pseudoobscura]